jgi:tetratricopeptide (TPR) repeat protein
LLRRSALSDGCSVMIAHSSIHSRAAIWAFLISLFVSGLAKGQAQAPVASSTVHGMVRDARGLPVPGATVFLRSEDGTQALTVRTTTDGSYVFSAVPLGSYTLRAEMAGYRVATLGSVALAEKQEKRIDLKLELASPASSPNPPEFFDEPRFAVAGVTDTTSLGGHGSDAVMRTRNALAKETAALGKPSAAGSQSSPPLSSLPSTEQTLREAADREPGSFDANRRIGTLLLGEDKAREALPYLERASQLDSGDYDNAYELALVRSALGDYERARTCAQALLARQDKAELHHLLADIEEKTSKPLEAVHEYQRAAELDPSESNLFDWGTELLLHHAPEPAIEVFSEGNRLFPRSLRMLVSLGVAWYAHGSYEEAARRLCEAADLSPADPVPYLFLGKIQRAESTPSDAVVEKLAQFARLHPENAMANYYYAVSLWKRRTAPDDNAELPQVRSLLQNAVRLDPKLGVGYLQMGILQAERNDLPGAISAYLQAIAASPRLEEAHYRLAQAYRRNGEKSKAQAELQLYNEIAKSAAGEIERERHDIKQFVYTLRNEPASTPP